MASNLRAMASRKCLACKVFHSSTSDRQGCPSARTLSERAQRTRPCARHQDTNTYVCIYGIYGICIRITDVCLNNRPEEMIAFDVAGCLLRTWVAQSTHAAAHGAIWMVTVLHRHSHSPQPSKFQVCCKSSWTLKDCPRMVIFFQGSPIQ